MKAALAGLALVLGLSIYTYETNVNSYEALEAATYKVQIMMGEINAGTCTGTLVAPETLVTAAHCVPDGYTVRVVDKDGVSKETRLIRKDSEKDTALLEVPMTKNYIPVHRGFLSKYTWVSVIGFPMDQEYVVTQGQYMGLEQSDEVYNGFSLITAPIAPGNSGGGAFIKTWTGWELIGVASHVRVVSVGMGGSLVYHLAGFANLPDLYRFVYGK